MDPENATRLKLHHRETGVEVVFRPTDFTQVNHRLNEVMVTRVLRLSHLEPSSKVIDFFCGLGNFTRRWRQDQQKFSVSREAPNWLIVPVQVQKTIISQTRLNLRLVTCLTGRWTIGMPSGTSLAAWIVF